MNSTPLNCWAEPSSCALCTCRVFTQLNSRRTPLNHWCKAGTNTSIYAHLLSASLPCERTPCVSSSETNLSTSTFHFTPADGWGRPCHCKLVRPFRPVIVLNLIYSLLFPNFFYTSEWVAGTLLQNVYTSPWTNEPPTTWLG